LLAARVVMRSSRWVSMLGAAQLYTMNAGALAGGAQQVPSQQRAQTPAERIFPDDPNAPLPIQQNGSHGR
jgi:hypothetical protein